MKYHFWRFGSLAVFTDLEENPLTGAGTWLGRSSRGDTLLVILWVSHCAFLFDLRSSESSKFNHSYPQHSKSASGCLYGSRLSDSIYSAASLPFTYNQGDFQVLTLGYWNSCNIIHIQKNPEKVYGNTYHTSWISKLLHFAMFKTKHLTQISTEHGARLGTRRAKYSRLIGNVYLISTLHISYVTLGYVIQISSSHITPVKL